jgi:flagellar assembly protein FliH
MSSNVLKSGSCGPLPPVQWRVWSSELPKPASGPPAAPAGSAAIAARAAQLEKEAFERGFREGEASAARKASEQFQATARTFAENAAALAAYKPTLRSEVERELAVLALAVARKVVHRELSIDSNVVLAVVKACCEELRNAEIYRLRLHPQDVELIGAYLQQQKPARIDLVPDPAVGRGGAVFETSQGKLDARIETQLGEIARGLADR